MLHSSMETPQCTKVGTLTQKHITLSCQKFVKNKNKVYQDAIEIRKNLSKLTAVTICTGHHLQFHHLRM